MATTKTSKPKKKRKSQPSALEWAVTASLQDKSDYLSAIREQVGRYKEALRTYRPLPYQEAFHACKARRALIRKANRTGGTVCAMVEVARAVLGLDPHDKYPKKGICVLLGFGERHIGNIFHRYLFQPGAFFIRQDEKQGRIWVSCNREDPGAEPAPPMIPQKYVHEMSWETKSANIFSRVIIKNEATETEWEIIACNSKGDPNMLQGINVNLYVIDEDIANAGWFTEAIMRTNSVGGFIRWAAYPQASNDAMLHLLEECEDQEGEENPTAVLFKATMWDNIYTSEKAKHEDIKALQVFGEDVVKRRVLGELDLSPRRVYAAFDKTRHSVASYDVKVAETLKSLNYEPPADWCRYATLDPGSNVFAVLFWAVPPPKEFGEFAIIYDELYIHQSDAEKWGALFYEKTKGHDWQDFIIDSHGARLREQAGGELPRVHYQRQLQKRGIKAIASGTAFTDGSDNIAYREVTLREWLIPRVSEDELIDGTPKLLVVMSKCPSLLREMMRFKKKTRNIGGEIIVLDDADRAGTRHDAIDCAEYGVAHGMKYVRPPLSARNSTWFERVMAGRRERAARRRAQGAPEQSRGIVLGARGA
jgi:hypothetical protein